MNDEKYGRLYPERAVVAARQVLESLREEGAVAPARVEQALDALDKLGFPKNEPLFLLRGQDELAPDTVRFYLGIAEDRLAPIAKQHDHLWDFAIEMQRWQPRKLPD